MDQTAVGLDRKFDRLNALFAVIVAVISFIVYRMTVAQTFSYWDCGEFIACAHILGNPHPPGYPVFSLVGRFFDLLPIASDPALRINLMCSVSSAFTALFSYLIVVRLVTSWYVNSDHYKLGRIIAYASGFIGALFVAFSRANWTNSVEAEPRSLAMMLMMVIFWLSLKWFDHRYNAAGRRIILLIAFLALLSLGVHMTVFLVVPIITILFSLKRTTTPSEWGLVTGYLALELLMIFLLAGSFANYKIFLMITGVLFATLAFYLRQKINWPILLSFGALSPIMIGFYPFMFSAIGWLIISVIIWFARKDALWRLAALIMVMGLIGFSINIYIPVRSSSHPIIDENTPSRSFTTFVNFLDRKQYGSMSMTERMFVRRGSWANQFGDHDRMGFWYLFKDQYSDKSMIALFFAIGLFGLGVMAWKNPQWGYMFVVFVLLASVGLVLYMNFADGTKFNRFTGDAYQEVRNRYYFYTPAFALFGMAIGLGFGGIMEMIRRSTAKMGAGANRMAVFASLILILTPLVPLKASYFHNDRSRNRMAYNYAYNLLNSCDKDAILFTSGDNDTFPLWCIQEVYGIRKDVRVVNFSLLNTDWYTWQLKHLDSLSVLNTPYDFDSIKIIDSVRSIDVGTFDSLSRGYRKRVPISLTDEQILWEEIEGSNGQTVSRPQKPFYDRVRQRPALLVPQLYQEKQLKVSTMVMEDIILTNRWKYPIFFTSAAGDMRSSPLNLTERCYRQGLVLRLSSDIANLAYLEDKTDSLFFEVYKYDNISDTTIAQSENTTGINLAYPEKMLDYYEYILRRGDTARADSILDMSADRIPSYWRLRLVQSDRYRLKGDTARADEIIEEMMAYQNGFLNNNPDNIFFHQFMGTSNYTLGNRDLAEQYLEQAWDMNHDKEHTFRALLTLYAGQRRAMDMRRIALEYREYHEDDQVANEVIQSTQMLMQAPAQSAMPPASQPISPPPSGSGE